MADPDLSRYMIMASYILTDYRYVVFKNGFPT